MPDTLAYLGLGSNINAEVNIRFAVNRIQNDFAKVKVSNVYSSSAVGFEGDDFFNLAIEVETDLSLGQLLEYADKLEQQAGRVRVHRGRYDSRTLDVDVLMFGDFVGTYQGRQFPSEDIDQEAHVLLPMSEIASDKAHPTNGMRFAKLWKDFDQQQQLILKDLVW